VAQAERIFKVWQQGCEGRLTESCLAMIEEAAKHHNEILHIAMQTSRKNENVIFPVSVRAYD
jgi:hypothetical protein